MQAWSAITVPMPTSGVPDRPKESLVRLGMKAGRCDQNTIWAPGPDKTWVLVYPDTGGAPPPNNDLPDEVKADYREAASILNRSPRGAAALLRLAVQRLCKHLGQPGENINNDIKALVKNGLSPVVQQAMDTVRITGNGAVHPGEINLNDDGELALNLFSFVNLIAEHQITGPRILEEMYGRLPESKRAEVKRRDGG